MRGVAPRTENAVRVKARAATLDGDLIMPAPAHGVVLFAHGSGSSRFSPRNRFVAEELNAAGLATLLIDLLTPSEAALDLQTAHLRFDIELLAARLVATTAWLGNNEDTRLLPIGYFGASTGGGAALVAAAQRPNDVAAVVSRGGRPDLAGAALPNVRAPTMLIVGADDQIVLGMNEAARAQMKCPVELVQVPGASHLFQERGKLEEVTRLARDWFLRHLPGHNAASK